VPDLLYYHRESDLRCDFPFCGKFFGAEYQPSVCRLFSGVSDSVFPLMS